MKNITVNAETWRPSILPSEIPHGDMPGDRVEIGEGHIAKANLIFPELLKGLLPALKNGKKTVVCVCGGSGVGKSETASVLAAYFSQAGIGSYTLSGDNYPRRIPMYNDAERLRIFRESAIRGMVAEAVFSKEHFEIIQKLQEEGMDASYTNAEKYPFMESYLRNGRAGLKDYLGSSQEIDFEQIERILKAFKQGKEKLWLKRMGRTDTQLWYDEVDFSHTQVLIIEWTHGNSDNFSGVDLPILLNSTPQETLAHRRARNRDGATDSPFTTMVLELEQAMLHEQAHKAKLIVSKSGELLSYEEYLRRMEEAR